jgi:hypothetical protein
MPLVYIAASRPQHQAPVSQLEGFDLFLSTIVDDREDWGKKQTCLFCSGSYRYSPQFVETHLDASINMNSTGKARQVFLCVPFVQHRARMLEVLAEIVRRRKEGCGKKRSRPEGIPEGGEIAIWTVEKGKTICHLDFDDAGVGGSSSRGKRSAVVEHGKVCFICYLLFVYGVR